MESLPDEDRKVYETENRTKELLYQHIVEQCIDHVTVSDRYRPYIG